MSILFTDMDRAPSSHAVIYHAMLCSKTSAPALLALAAVLANASAAAASAAHALPGECPDHYQVKPGLNVDFPIDGTKRAFVVVPPANLGEP
jgi:hypothetical protein